MNDISSSDPPKKVANISLAKPVERGSIQNELMDFMDITNGNQGAKQSKMADTGSTIGLTLCQHVMSDLRHKTADIPNCAQKTKIPK
jgi:hypothetical protein